MVGKTAETILTHAMTGGRQEAGGRTHVRTAAALSWMDFAHLSPAASLVPLEWEREAAEDTPVLPRNVRRQEARAEAAMDEVRPTSCASRT